MKKTGPTPKRPPRTIPLGLDQLRPNDNRWRAKRRKRQMQERSRARNR